MAIALTAAISRTDAPALSRRRRKHRLFDVRPRAALHRETGGIRFGGRVEFWVEVGSLDHAEQVMHEAERAALGGGAIDDPDSGGAVGTVP